jgi:uncharacterized membrane protein
MRDSSQWLVYGVLHGEWIGYLTDPWGFHWPGFTDEELQSPRVQWSIAVFSVFLTIFLLYTIGAFAANVLGHRILDFMERVVDRLPLIKTVYRASKQILMTFTSQQDTTFQRVALVPFPNTEVRSIGFITGTSIDATSGEDLCTCFIATTPNPTTGFVFLLKRSDVVELDWSIEDAVKVVMSGGILVPGSVGFQKDG